MDAGARPSVATTCPYCGVGCGVLARPEADGVAVSGDPNHPANLGRLCAKGMALGETVGLEGRLLHPAVAGRRASWEAAIAAVADAFSHAIAAHGPDAVALYGSGQLLTEDYYVANKFMKGFVGSANIDTNSRLCMASSVAGHKRAFGADTVPGTYEDLEAADLLVLVGSNLAWCHPVLFQRVMAAKALRPAMRIVVIDPRKTATTAAADLHLALAPDTDVPLFAGLLNHVHPTPFLAHTEGSAEALEAAARWTIPAVAAATSLSEGAIAAFYEAFAETEKTVTVYSQGVNQSACGTDKVNAILNVHLSTGRIGRPGMGPFSATGQPNAMGGREVGGLANMLACHMELGNAAHRAIVQRHWAAPRMASAPGLKAVDLFEAVHDGRIKALWVMATNPSASLPDAARVDEALKRVPFLAVSDVVASTDTLRHADVALPAAAWGEKDGTVTNSERRVSRQRAFLPLPGEARPDWAIISDVATAMGFDGFNYTGPHEIFDEHAALSAADNNGTRDFDIGGLVGLGRAGYDRLAPQQWPIRAGAPPKTRFFADGRFYTPSGRAQMVATHFQPPQKRAPRYPFVLNTGRVRDQWHTMTRTGRAPTLSAHIAEPFVEIHPDDAAAIGVGAADLAVVENPRGRIIVRVLVTARQRRGNLFVPIHWTDETSACARVDALVDPVTDPHSGQPALKSARVAVRPFRPALYGFAVSTTAFARPPFAYFAEAPVPAGVAMEFAALDADANAALKTLFGDRRLDGVTDQVAGTHRFAAMAHGRVTGAVFLAPAPVAVSRAHVIAALGTDAPLSAVLAGRPPAGVADPGPTVCTCFGVGANPIRAAIADGATTVEAVGACLSAGTNCGSCRAEIAQLIAAAPSAKGAREGVLS
ncbi:MAG: molybdopterin-dependent oxidoreductase [Pseudomonadota bacterium]